MRTALFFVFSVALLLAGYSEHATAQVTPTTAPTFVATSSPTTVPTTAPTSYATSVPTMAPAQIPAYTVTFPIPVLGSPPPTHVMTADYYLTSALMANCATQIAPYLTYYYPTSALRSQAKACGLKSVIYMTPSMPQKGEQEYAMMSGAVSPSYAAAEAKDCSGNAVTTYVGSGLLMDPHSQSALAYYQAVVDYYYNAITSSGGSFDAIFSDNSDEDYGASAQPCDWTGYADWTTATTGVLSQLNTHGAQLFLNDLSLPEAYSVTPTDDTVQNFVNSTLPATVTGGEQEGFLFDVYPNRPQWWSEEMNTQIAVVNARRVYWAYSNHGLAKVDPASPSGLQWRSFLYASFLLTYDPNYSIFQEWFTTASQFKVMPETGIVPLAPIQTAQTDVSELKNSAGYYERDFAQCFYRAVPIGGCAVVANPGATSVSVSTSYRHSVMLGGSDIDDGGGAWLFGPQVTQLGPVSGAVLTQ